MPQSNLYQNEAPSFFVTDGDFLKGPAYRAIKNISLIYLAMWVLSLVVYTLQPAFALGLILPGGGFLVSAYPLYLTLLTMLLFGAAVFLWFATGNAIGPVFVWAAALIVSVLLPGGPAESDLSWMMAAGPLAIAVFWAGRYGLWQARKSRLSALNAELLTIAPRAKAAVISMDKTLSPKQMAGLRFLLDRALQPVDAFEGFEHRDPFQTAALRYQINFISYALSLVQMNYLPALGGYLTEAQSRLKSKQEQPRIWRYWAKENAWGNLALGRDPIAKDNIMYSGFVATQMMMALKTAPHSTPGFMGELSGADRDYSFAYSRAALIETLADQYRDARFGLLPCEPNWVYPLCNFITAAAISAHDSQFESDHWAQVKDNFRHLCERDFMGVDGHFIPFRSSYTGLAAPQVGGLVMKTFPCFFLNALFPDMAERQWWLTRKYLEDNDLRRACWPVDVGNYNYSRAAAYGASALAAAEMGDTDLKSRLLELMEQDCSSVQSNGRFYFRGGSIWANANAFAASVTRPGSFRQLVTTKTAPNGPYIERADPQKVQFSSAYHDGDNLCFTAHPQNGTGYTSITLNGLRPGQSYQLLHPGGKTMMSAPETGQIDINLPFFEPTEFLFSPGA